MRIYLFLLVAAVSSCLAQNNDPRVFCDGRSIELRPSPNAIYVKGANPVFASTEQYSTSNMRVTNTGEQDIIRLLVIVDYLNDRSERLISVGHYYRDEAIQAADAHTNFEGERHFAALAHREHLWSIGNGEKGPIAKRGGVKLISGVSDLVVTGCPSFAMVTAIAIEYADGDVKSFFAPGWHLDLEAASSSVTYGWLKDVSPPNESLMAVHGLFNFVVSSNGCAAVAIRDKAQWLSVSVPHWLMISAQTDGKPVEAMLMLGVVIHSRTGLQRSWDLKGSLPEVMAVAHIYQDEQRGVISFGSSPLQRVESCGIAPGAAR